jgi:hypothetical protein
MAGRSACRRSRASNGACAAFRRRISSMAERRAMPAGPCRSLDVSMDHRAFARRNNPKSSCAEGFGPRRRVKPGGDDVSDCAAAAQRVATAWCYAGFIRSLFVSPVECTHLDLAGVFHAGPMCAAVAAVGAYQANHGQWTRALLGCCAFSIIRPSADAHERARCDDRRKQYRTSHGHDFSPFDVVSESDVARVRQDDCRESGALRHLIGSLHVDRASAGGSPAEKLPIAFMLRNQRL